MTLLSPYRGPDERERDLERLAAQAGGTVVEIGRSRPGLPIRAVRVPSSASSGGDMEVPSVACFANIHGPEFVGAHVALGLLDALGRGHDPELVRLRARAHTVVVPCINVDGYARTVERGGEGSVASLRTTEDGVDLNRNFPVPYGGTPSSFPGAAGAHRGQATWRGPHPLSEPEAQAVFNLCAAERFHGSVSLHSFMGTLITPRVPDRADFRTYGDLCRAFRRGQRGTKYVRFASRLFDVFTGELEDHQHHALQCWSVCVEVFPLWHSFRQHLRAPSVFWRFNPRAPDRYVHSDVPGIAAFLHAALDRPRPGAPPAARAG